MSLTLISPLVLPTVVLAANSPVIDTSINESISNRDAITKEEGTMDDHFDKETLADSESDSINKKETTDDEVDTQLPDIETDTIENKKDIQEPSNKQSDDTSQPEVISEQQSTKEKETLTSTYETIISEKKVHYDGTIITDKENIYSEPGYKESAKVIGKTANYLNETIQIIAETVTNQTTWIQISLKGKVIGWMNKDGATIQYDTFNASEKVNYNAIVYQGHHDVYSLPGYTNGNTIIGKSSAYINQTIQVLEEKKTSRATWALISKNGVQIGWMNKNGIKLQTTEVKNSKKTHLKAIIASKDHSIYSAPGYTANATLVSTSAELSGNEVHISEQKQTELGTIWFLISQNNKKIGWIEQSGVTIQYDTILSTQAVHYEAVVTQGRHDVYTAPGYTANNEILTKSSSYLNETVQITKEVKTNRATWAQINRNGKSVWMNKVGLSIVYDEIISTEDTDYYALITQGQHDIYTVPGYTNGNQIIGKSANYLNQEVKVSQEKMTSRAKWAQIEVNGKVIGWMNKNGLKEVQDTVTSSQYVHYEAVIPSDNAFIYSQPGYTQNAEIISNSSKYVNQTIKISEQKTTNRSTWFLVSLSNGKTVGWMEEKALVLKFDTVLTSQKVDTPAIVNEGRHDIYTLPGYTKGNQIIAKSASYLNKKVTIVEERVTNRATWALIKTDNQAIGWMNKKGLKLVGDKPSETIISTHSVHYDALVKKDNQLIYSHPGHKTEANEVGQSTDYLNKLVRITRESKTDQATWSEISFDGKVIGWIDNKSLAYQYDVITSSKALHYDATITAGHHDVYTVPGYTKNNKIVSKSAPYINEKVQIVEEKTTKRATWLRFSINGKVIGWMNKNGVALQPDKIDSKKAVHYDAVITAGHHDVYTVPGYTTGNQIISKSASYMDKTIKVVALAHTNRATFAQFSIDGKIIGWMNINGINYNYDEILSTKETNYNAKVIQGHHDIYTAPGYTSGNEIIGKSSSYLNHSVQILQQRETKRATWALIAMNGKKIGWMNKNGLNSMLVYLDPGHGGTETGAYSGGIKEKDINLKVGLKIEKLLVSNGYDVVMSRKTDKFVSLSDRAQEANRLKADIFVSVHHNAFIGTSQGIETYAYNRLGNSNNPMSNNTKRSLESGKLSNAVHHSLLNHSGAINRGTRTANFHVIRETNMPAILMELGYMDNATERAKLVNDSYQNKLAKGAYEGIAQYFK